MADICHVGLGRRVRRMVRSRFPWFQRRRVPGAGGCSQLWPQTGDPGRGSASLARRE